MDVQTKSVTDQSIWTHQQLFYVQQKEETKTQTDISSLTFISDNSNIFTIDLK